MKINADSVWAAAMDLLSAPRPRQEPIKLTRDQWDVVAAAFGHNQRPESGVVSQFAGVRVELVEDVSESTPVVDGWAALSVSSEENQP